MKFYLSEKYKHSLCLSLYLDFNSADWYKKYSSISEWLEETIVDSYEFCFEYYGQHGLFVLYLNNDIDVTAFKIKFGI